MTAQCEQEQGYTKDNCDERQLWHTSLYGPIAQSLQDTYSSSCFLGKFMRVRYNSCHTRLQQHKNTLTCTRSHARANTARYSTHTHVRTPAFPVQEEKHAFHTKHKNFTSLSLDTRKQAETKPHMDINFTRLYCNFAMLPVSYTRPNYNFYIITTLPRPFN